MTIRDAAGSLHGSDGKYTLDPKSPGNTRTLRADVPDASPHLNDGESTTWEGHDEYAPGTSLTYAMSRKRDVYTVTRTSTTDGEFAEQIAGTEGVSRARLAVYAPYIDQAYSSPDQQVEGLGAACLDPRASLTYTTRMDISEREIGSFEDMDDLATEMGDAEEREGEYGQNAVLSRLEIWERTTDKLEDILRTRCIDDRDTERDGRVSGEYWEPEIRAVRIDDRAQSKMAAECVEFLQANDTQLEQYYREHQHEPGVTRGTVHDDVAEYIFSGDDAEPSSFRDFAQECDERNGISSRGAQGQLFNIDGPTLRVTAK